MGLSKRMSHTVGNCMSFTFTFSQTIVYHVETYTLMISHRHLPRTCTYWLSCV